MGTPPSNTATILAGVTMSAVAAVACGWMSRRRPTVTTSDHTLIGARVLRYPATLRWAALVVGWALAVGWPIGFAVFVVVDPPDEGMQWLPYFVLVAVLSLPGLLLVGSRFGEGRVTVTDFDVTAERPGRPPTTIAWDEVARVTFGLTGVHGTAWVIVAADGRRIYAGAYLKGLGLLADAVRAHLDPSTYAAAGRGFRYVDLLAQINRSRP